MKRITFERAGNRTSYTHFVEPSGDIIALTALEKRELRVGVVFDEKFPNDLQRQAIAHLANIATGLDPTIEIVFSEGCSPFPGTIPATHPFSDLCGA